jgi:N-sulfoglucosamine sulfohydrolase
LGAKSHNILFIFMEDMGLQLSVYGDNSAPTPALERLASQGVVYNHAYCTQATCSPSRSSVYSGQYPHQTGHMGLAGNYGYAMQPGFTTFLSLLKQKHYFTGYSYKIHVAPNQAIAKDYDRAYNISRFVKDKTDPKDFHQSAKYFRDFLQEKPNDQSFFYMAQTHDTHEPFKRGAFKTAPNAHPYKTLLGKDVKPLKSFGRGQTFEGYFADQVASYYNAIQRVDAFVAQIMKTLEDSGHHDDTEVVFHLTMAPLSHGANYPPMNLASEFLLSFAGPKAKSQAATMMLSSPWSTFRLHFWISPLFPSSTLMLARASKRYP